MMAGRHFTALALAYLCATFVAVDGPLLQRASSVQSRPPSTPIIVRVLITPEIPSYFTGVGLWYGDPRAAYGFGTQPDFRPIAQNAIAKHPLTGDISGCPGECGLNERATALALRSCESKLKYMDYTARWSLDEAYPKPGNANMEKQETTRCSLLLSMR